MKIMEEPRIQTGRISSLDQFRGFAIFGMILVNYLGYFEAIPETMKHPRFGMTFANAIAPFFLFVVGMGFRMSLKNHIRKFGKQKSYLMAVKRYLILIIIGIAVYGPDPVCDMWDALVDIGFAGLLTLPFILSNRWIRISLAFVYLIVYQCLFIYTGYGEWTMQHSIDGGPLGIISWASILFFGTVLMDDLYERTPAVFMKRSLITGLILMALGYGLSLLQPEPLWQFSQRSMTMAYPVFASGLSFVVFVLFYWLADMKKIQIPHLAVLGMNPLILYIVQNVLIELHGDLLNRKTPVWQALCGFVVIYLLCYAVARYMDRSKMLVKI
ncbi:MAG: heparan-alpha-glucosaminide N-acetyltransferase domain-containing protein [Bacteroidales bacterium]|nr:heparan-alpha-glucosaminide N-acetyltransferase domain-containing protein [Bacteroidales bacterium]